ncbi:MAG: putative addiction module component (TIGR02574 family) [Flavobacterium sp.]|jgi:putative addiction module component (TIGR02574 family)
MKIKDIDKFSTAEKIALAEELWDSVAKEDIEISDEVKQELDYRLSLVEEDKTEYYTWDEVKAHLKNLR